MRRNKNTNEKEFISFSNYQKRVYLFQNMEIIPKKSILKIGLGITCLGIAFIPNGLGLFFYPLGFMLLGIKKEVLLNGLYNMKIKLKYGRFV